VASTYLDQSQWSEKDNRSQIPDLSPEFITQITNVRLAEDNNAMLYLFSQNFNNLRVERHGYQDAPIRHYKGDPTAGGGPAGNFKNFREQEIQIYNEITQDIKYKLATPDCKLYVPQAIGNHIDHFIVREAVIRAGKEMANKTTCQIFFTVDQPYYGAYLSKSQQQLNQFVERLKLSDPINTPVDKNEKLKLFKKLYPSQYDDNVPQKENLYYLALTHVDHEPVYSWNKNNYAKAHTDKSCDREFCKY
jgi:hypothetical protein